MLWWVGFRRRFMYAASTVRMDLHNSFASCYDLIMWPPDTRDTVSTTTSSDQTCTGSCRRRSTLDTCRTCPTAFSWFAISIDIWCMSLSTRVSSGTVMKSFQLAIAPCFSFVFITRQALGALGFYSSLFFVKYIYGSIKCDWAARGAFAVGPKLAEMCGSTTFGDLNLLVLCSWVKSLLEPMMIR